MMKAKMSNIYYKENDFSVSILDTMSRVLQGIDFD
jgi:hypothetical protein